MKGIPVWDTKVHCVYSGIGFTIKLCNTTTHESFLYLTSCYVEEIYITFPDLA